jgi:uncharacterized membrane protein YkvA (DUF1232 family)
MADQPDPPIPADGKPPADTTGFAKFFSDPAFWQKVKDFAGKLGRGTLQKAMELYHVAMSPDTPLWAKAVAVGSLGYLILPLDAIPDIIPIAGLGDDAAALTAAAFALAKNITPAIQAKALEQVNKWLGVDPKAAPPETPAAV